MSSSRTYAAWAAAIACGLLLTYILWPRQATTELERQAMAEGRVIITYWDRHFGHEHTSRVELFDEFNRSQNEVFIRATPIGYNAAMEKILTSTAGGAPPDICSLDTPMVAQLAGQGLFLPLDDFVASIPTLRQEAIFEHAWEMCTFDGHTWALPTTTDAYCLLWNKALFRKAGLDPEVPPRTLKELEEFAAKLTVYSPEGRLEQMGFVPWLPWDHTLLWGAMFGGTWFDEDTRRLSIEDDQAIIDSLAWQQTFTLGDTPEEQRAYAMGAEHVDAYSEGARDYMSANNHFYGGKVAMILEGEWQPTFVPRYAPGLDWGVAPIPQPEGAPTRAFSPTCIVDVIPATSRNPEAAKKFLRWFYSPRANGGPSPVSDYNYAIHNIPTIKEEARQPRFSSDPKFSVFVEQFSRGEIVHYPVMPLTQFMADQLLRQRELVVLRQTTPEAAVKSIQTMVNRELERVDSILERNKS